MVKLSDCNSRGVINSQYSVDLFSLAFPYDTATNISQFKTNIVHIISIKKQLKATDISVRAVIAATGALFSLQVPIP